MTSTTTPALPSAPALGAGRPARRHDRLRTATLGLQITLALFYAFGSAAPKLLAVPEATRSFDRIGFGHWFMYLTGTLELLGAIALVVPVLYQAAAVCLIGLMICATITQITVFHGAGAATPVIFMLPLALVAWVRADSTPRLVALVRGAVRRSAAGAAPGAAAQR